MTQDEVIRWFRRLKYDPEFRSSTGAHNVPQKLLAEFAGVPIQNLKLILNGGLKLSKNYEVRLERAIQAVQDGLRWRRRGQQWEMVDDRFEALPRLDYSKHRAQA